MILIIQKTSLPLMLNKSQKWTMCLKTVCRYVNLDYSFQFQNICFGLAYLNVCVCVDSLHVCGAEKNNYQVCRRIQSGGPTQVVRLKNSQAASFDDVTTQLNFNYMKRIIMMTQTDARCVGMTVITFSQSLFFSPAPLHHTTLFKWKMIFLLGSEQ